MHIHTNRDSLSANPTNLQHSNEGGIHLYSNRPEAITQQRLQETANESPQVRQLKAYQDLANTRTITNSGSDQPIQLMTQIITQQDQTYNYGTGTINVGSVMEVGLDPNHMEQGQSANLNISQDDMMDAIRGQWGIVGGGLVKGHLWNDNLGGSAMNFNLFPITKAANSDHLGYVENKAKEYIWGQKRPIYYKVEVDGTPDINNQKTDFDCEIRDWDPVTGNLGGLLFGPVTIESDLGDVGAYNEAYETYTGNPADRQKRPKKPKWATAPKTRVGELSKQEAIDRANQ